jgi:hypothetical protein
MAELLSADEEVKAKALLADEVGDDDFKDALEDEEFDGAGNFKVSQEKCANYFSFRRKVRKLARDTGKLFLAIQTCWAGWRSPTEVKYSSIPSLCGIYWPARRAAGQVRENTATCWRVRTQLHSRDLAVRRSRW